MLTIAIAILSGVLIGYGLGLRAAYSRGPAIVAPIIVEAWGAGVLWGVEGAAAAVRGSHTESVGAGFLAWAKSKGVEVAR